MKLKKKTGPVIIILICLIYFFGAARPVPLENVLFPRWVSSLESGEIMHLQEAAEDMHLIPFLLGNRFGYVDGGGRFTVNKTTNAGVSFADDRWAEYHSELDSIEIRDVNDNIINVIYDPRGYPFFLDGRNFLIGKEQNSISEVSSYGGILWTHEFEAPLICVDAAAGLLVAGTLNGVVSVLDSGGNLIFSFAPGGSRYEIILGSAISSDGSRIGIISGIDPQRFLVLERHGGGLAGAGIAYRVVYHEFLDTGFRRPVHISFIENDRWIVFERGEGLSFFRIGSRQSSIVELQGEVRAIDTVGGGGIFFAVVAYTEDQKKLVSINLPARMNLMAPFRSRDVFLRRTDTALFIGGGESLASFSLERK